MGRLLGPLHRATQAAVITIKIKLRYLKSREHIHEKNMGHTAVSATQASSVTLKI